jgi:hypothetical protein
MNARGIWVSLGLLLALGAPAGAWDAGGEGLTVVGAYPGQATVGDNYCAVSVENCTNCKTVVSGTLTVKDSNGQTKLTRTTGDREVEGGDTAALYFGTVSLAEGDVISVDATSDCDCAEDHKGSAHATSNSAEATTASSGDVVDAGMATSGGRHANYQVPANANWRALAFNPENGRALRLVFGGPKELRILKITTTSGVENTLPPTGVEDPGLAPAAATQWFMDNPLPPNAGQVLVFVSNKDGREHQLAVSAVNGR